jgi:thiaminase
LAFGLAKAPIGSSWSRTASAILDEIFVADEIEAKREIVQSLGVDCLFDRWSLSPRREAYVNHIMRTALEGTIGEIAAVLLPCTYFTTLVGRRFEGVDIQGPEAYRRWAAIYAAKQMYSMLSAHIEMIEMEANQNPFSRGELIRIFVRSVQHQVAVFDDALEPGAPWPEVGLEGFGSALA